MARTAAERLASLRDHNGNWIDPTFIAVNRFTEEAARAFSADGEEPKLVEFSLFDAVPAGLVIESLDWVMDDAYVFRVHTRGPDGEHAGTWRLQKSQVRYFERYFT